MTPDQQQQQWLKQYLRSVLKYHETYEEIYDHILLALENRPKDNFFESTVNSIINDDFGGINGLFKMEKNCKAAVSAEVRKQYRRYFFTYLKFPYVIYAVAIAVLAGYIASRVSVDLVFLSGAIWIVAAAMIPVMLFAGRKFKMGYKLENPQRLLKDSVLGRLTAMPFGFIAWYFFLGVVANDIQGVFNYKLTFNPWEYIGPVILIFALVALTIHALSFIRIIKGEFKISMIR